MRAAGQRLTSFVNVSASQVCKRCAHPHLPVRPEIAAGQFAGSFPTQSSIKQLSTVPISMVRQESIGVDGMTIYGEARHAHAQPTSADGSAYAHLFREFAIASWYCRSTRARPSIISLLLSSSAFVNATSRSNGVWIPLMARINRTTITTGSNTRSANERTNPASGEYDGGRSVICSSHLVEFKRHSFFSLIAAQVFRPVLRPMRRLALALTSSCIPPTPPKSHHVVFETGSSDPDVGQRSTDSPKRFL